MRLLSGFHIGPVRVRPGLVLAPMEGHTNSAFRRLVKAIGGCGLVYSEMTTSGALVKGGALDRTGLKVFTPDERPLAFQVTGCDPGEVAEAAQRFAALGPDLIDINMGCPSHNAGTSGHGAALLKDVGRARAVIRAVVAAVRPLPVSLKMRAGWDDRSLVLADLGQAAEAEGVAMLALHPRTKAQGYAGTAPWERIARLKAAVRVPVVGCGDVTTPEAAVRMRQETGCDGVMIGRGALVNPWIFAQTVALLETGWYPRPDLAEKLTFIERHLEASLAVEPEERLALRRIKGLAGHITKGMPQGASLRLRLNDVRSHADFLALLCDYRSAVLRACGGPGPQAPPRPLARAGA
ncbi:MAG TPA: tRNA dihydrouridine synthase DusB [Candidatus Methylomirabilis sp.]|jgi:nifR3 family TIM-barrel protein